jgi:uncharacterized protein with PIN domain
MQIVNINDTVAICKQCGADIVDVANFTFSGKVDTTATCIEEYCKCQKCKTDFLLHYDIFDPSGHIYSKIFTEDINNVNYNWQDALTEDQKKVVSDHLEKCPECLDRLSQELLTDAWLKSFINALRDKPPILKRK